MTTDILAAVTEVITRYFREQGKAVPVITSESRIMADLGMDSLALAEIVISLEDTTGKDPFAAGFRGFETVGELAALYV